MVEVSRLIGDKFEDLFLEGFPDFGIVDSDGSTPLTF